MFVLSSNVQHCLAIRERIVPYFPDVSQTLTHRTERPHDFHLQLFTAVSRDFLEDIQVLQCHWCFAFFGLQNNGAKCQPYSAIKVNLKTAP